MSSPFRALAANVRADVERITIDIPHRAAGSQNGRRMALYSREALERVGVSDARIDELPAIVSFPEHAEFLILGEGGRRIEANTLGHSILTPPEGVDGELVHVGSGAFEDYEGKDVRGKIILTELSYLPARHEKQRIAALMGAVGAVMMNWGHPGNEAVPYGSVKPAWGVPTPDTFADEMPSIACIGISRVEGLRLKEMCSSSPVRVRLTTHVENGWRPVQITVGEVKAPETSPEWEDFVLVGGHQDSWPGPQATDNAAGSACTIELARLVAENRGSLRRGAVFGFWTAHETGTMAGSAWYADQNWDRLRENAVAYLQIDQPACAGATARWATSSNAELRRFHSRVESEVLTGTPSVWKRAVKNGDSSFFGIGIPMFHGEGAFAPEELAATAQANLGWWHHSVHNTLDKLDWDWMQVHLDIYAAWLWELLTAPVLPFSYVEVATQILDRVAELARLGGPDVGLGSALAQAELFLGQARRLDALADGVRGAFREGRGDEDAARLVNRTFKRLSRLLVPLQSTAKGTYGHDPYGFTPQTTMIPALYDVPRLAATTDEERRWMLQTALRRARNRVADTLNDSGSLIDELGRQLGADRRQRRRGRGS
ncbi:M28 family peptidase [Aureimonas populi]|uniref:M28 family peptidase n=1 Tax=Aureimonas populi TaxID=1701758 RepID=A0ABW5CPZ8_9HYPH|nr:M28 family peptidase [Aureimonas populi]